VKQIILLLLLSCAKSHMLSASRRQPHLLHVSAVDRRQTNFSEQVFITMEKKLNPKVKLSKSLSDFTA